MKAGQSEFVGVFSELAWNCGPWISTCRWYIKRSFRLKNKIRSYFTQPIGVWQVYLVVRLRLNKYVHKYKATNFSKKTRLKSEPISPSHYVDILSVNLQIGERFLADNVLKNELRACYTYLLIAAVEKICLNSVLDESINEVLG
jgi:hypothetical protein